MKNDILKIVLTLGFILTAIYLRHDLTKGHDHEVLHGYELRSSY